MATRGSVSVAPVRPVPLDEAGPISVPVRHSWWEKHGRTTSILGLRILVLLAFLAAWQLASGSLVDPLFISSPSAIVAQLVHWIGDGTLYSNTVITVQEVILGFALGAAAGIVIGFALAILDTLGRVVEPYMIALYSIPKVALAPLFIIWFGIDIQMKVLLAAVTVFFLVFLNTLAGARSVDPELINAARLMGASSRQILVKVVLPGSMSGVITGLRVGVPYALLGAVVGELVASNRGLGYLMLDSASQFRTAGVFAALAVVVLIAMILNAAVNLLEARLTRWRPAGMKLAGPSM